MVQHVALFPCAFQVEISNPGKPSCLFSCAIFFTFDFVWHHVFMWFQNRVARGPAFWFSPVRRYVTIMIATGSPLDG